MATLSIFAATTAVTLSHEHEVSTSASAPHLVGDAFAAWWNGSKVQALYRRWDGHLGELWRTRPTATDLVSRPTRTHIRAGHIPRFRRNSP